jgi:hypothetical protein
MTVIIDHWPPLRRSALVTAKKNSVLRVRVSRRAVATMERSAMRIDDRDCELGSL